MNTNQIQEELAKRYWRRQAEAQWDAMPPKEKEDYEGGFDDFLGVWRDYSSQYRYDSEQEFFDHVRECLQEAAAFMADVAEMRVVRPAWEVRSSSNEKEIEKLLLDGWEPFFISILPAGPKPWFFKRQIL